jgi:NAD(P)-dependent dehydrogenase (short-subunit alcohol dehydrogenase family)
MAAVRSFAEQGAHVCILDVSQQGANIVKGLASEYPQATLSFHKADITDWDALAQIFEQILH